ncbi:unnamed protein product [Orchesella dallaii]|uniref:Uncharacterized protein n=1 Tax=Orchesella dallaii TaxID=48710 RepID=A0ABP1PLH0_9HEXA
MKVSLIGLVQDFFFTLPIQHPAPLSRIIVIIHSLEFGESSFPQYLIASGRFSQWRNPLVYDEGDGVTSVRHNSSHQPLVTPCFERLPLNSSAPFCS